MLTRARERGIVTAPFDPFGSDGRAGPTADSGATRETADAIPSGGSSMSSTMNVAGPPVLFVVGACGIALVGLVVGIVAWASAAAIVGWVVSGPIAIGTLAAFVLVDTKRRSEPIYASPGWTRPLYSVAMAVSIAGIVVGAVGFALWVGRL